MAFKRHKYPPYVKSLLHFDFGYPDSVADASATTDSAGGLRDEIGLETWTRSGYVSFVGQEAPAIEVAGTPKFGWRCPQFGGTADFVLCANASGIWNLKASGKYEISFFIRPTGSSAGNLFALRGDGGDIFSLSKNTGNELILQCADWGDLYETSEASLSTNIWQMLTIRISGKHISVYVDLTEVLAADITTDTTLAVSEARVGGYIGQADEFSFKHTAFSGAPEIPLVPMQGHFDINTVGGYGNGSFGDETLSAAGNIQINTYAPVTAMYAGAATIGAINNGNYGTFVPGNEVMIHLSLKRGTDEGDLGKYAIRRIARIEGGDLVFDRPVNEEFAAATAADDYYVQVLSVPNYNTLTVGLNTVIVPKLWAGGCGGIVAFKSRGKVLINGKVLCEAMGPSRTDSLKLTHADIAERFINAGNAFILCGGTLSALADARIGSPQPGDLGGASVGFGGDSIAPRAIAAGGKPGFHGQGGISQGLIGTAGGGGAGTAGKGGAGGDAAATSSGTAKPGKDGETAFSAPNLLIVARKLAVATDVISCGGGGGGGGGSGIMTNYNYSGANGGGGGASKGAGGAGGARASTYNNGKAGAAGTALRGGAGGNNGGAGGLSGGTGYGGYGGAGHTAGSAPPTPGGGGGGGGGTGFAYISCEEMGYDG